MESFIFSEMNRASRMKDNSKIKYYGAFASALGFIIHCGNHKSTEFKNKFTVYRGFKLAHSELEKMFVPGEMVNLLGFTSTSLSRDRALRFSLRKELMAQNSKSQVPVLLEINFKGSTQFFSLNSSDYSSYPME